MKFLLSLSVILITSGLAWSEPRFACCFGDNAVLQQGEETSVWGFDADPSQKLSVQLGDFIVTADIRQDGTWKASFPRLEASTTQQDLKLLTDGTLVEQIDDIVIGEVWLAAGQSNMAMQVRSMVKQMPPAAKWVESANSPHIRYRRISDPVLADHNITAMDLQKAEPWTKMTPESVPAFSAVAAVFAGEIAKQLKCPVGIIDVSWGGKPIEPFIPLAAYNTPFLQTIKSLADAGKLDELKQLHGGVIIRNPEGYPGAIFNARIAPLTQMSLAGYLWYQAESNSGSAEDPREYRHKMAALANGWRSQWGKPSLPLYFVQLPSFPSAKGWIRVREEQRLSLSIPHTAMAVTIDIRGEGIHPPDKIEVGERLAKCALSHTYQKPVVPSGPRYKSHRIDQNKIVVNFSDCNGGLVTGNRPLFSEVELIDTMEVNWFEVAGKDGVWHSATATISGDSVIAHSEDESDPVAVRYACHTSPQGANLYNQAGLPASPFCSDLKMLGWQN